MPTTAPFRAKRLDLGGFINSKIIRDHTKRKVFEKYEPQRYERSLPQSLKHANDPISTVVLTPKTAGKPSATSSAIPLSLNESAHRHSCSCRRCTATRDQPRFRTDA